MRENPKKHHVTPITYLNKVRVRRKIFYKFGRKSEKIGGTKIKAIIHLIKEEVREMGETMDKSRQSLI